MKPSSARVRPRVDCVYSPASAAASQCARSAMWKITARRYGARVRVDVFTIFPELVDGFCSASLLGKARDAGILDLRLPDLREHTTDVHRSIDDAPFGGGAGMVIRPEPVFASVEAADPPRPLLLLGPAGTRFTQPVAHAMAATSGF